MKIITKLILVSGTLFTVVLLFEKFHGNVTESEARNMAEKNFLKICANFDIDQHDFFGPTVSNGEGFPYEFEWANITGHLSHLSGFPYRIELARKRIGSFFKT
jgi:hypothetical protein